MFPKVKRCRKDSLKGLMQILDRVFSEYIRRRDAGGSEYAKCITCGTVKPWREGDCGHFICRNHLILRWEPRNANFQCPSCNRFKGGEQHLHGVAIDKKYGTGTANELQALSKYLFKPDRMWLDNQIEVFRKKITEIKNKC